MTEVDLSKYEALAWKIARQYRSSVGWCLDLEDLVQAAWLGLVRARNTFDPKRGVKFITYAMPFAMDFVRREARANSRTVRFPDRRYKEHSLPPREWHVENYEDFDAMTEPVDPWEKQRAEFVREAVDALPPEHSAYIRERYLKERKRGAYSSSPKNWQLQRESMLLLGEWLEQRVA